MADGWLERHMHTPVVSPATAQGKPVITVSLTHVEIKKNVRIGLDLAFIHSSLYKLIPLSLSV
jgi:hypothetical protein